MADDSLPQFIEQVTGESHLRVETDLGDGFVRLLSSEAERRQAKHDIRCVEDIVIEMLRNARDAHAGLIYLATMREGDTRRIIMIDDGDGIPSHLHQAVFEPRVTSKLDTYHMDRWGVHGRGMALYSISQNAREARVVASAPGLGAAMLVTVDVSELPERTDQSTLPHLVTGEDGRRVMRGPRNINRMVAEFVTESANAPQVFVGSPVQIAATLFRAGRCALAETQRRSDANALEPASAGSAGTSPSTNVSEWSAAASDKPLCLRPALTATPEELAAACEGIGLEMSVRSARRIMDGEIAPVPPFLSVLASGKASAANSAGKGKSNGMSNRRCGSVSDTRAWSGTPADQSAESRQGAVAGQPSATRQPASTNRTMPTHGATVADLRRPKDSRKVTLAPDEVHRIQAAVQRVWEPIARANYLDAQVLPQIRVAHDGVRIYIPAVHDDHD